MRDGKRIISQLLEIPSADPDDARRRKLLNILLTGLVILTLFGLAGQIVYDIAGMTDQEVAIPIFRSSLVMLVGAAIIFLINRYGVGWLASLLFLLLLTLLLTFTDRPQEVVEGRVLFMLAIPILMASALLRPYASFIAAGLIGLLLIGIALVAGLVPNFFAILGFFALALVSWLSARSLEHALKDLHIVNRELALLYRSGQVFNASLDLERVLVAVLDEVRPVLNAAACSIWLSDLETSELVCRKTTGIPNETACGQRLALGEGVAGRVAHTGESLIIVNTHAREQHKDVEQQTRRELRSILCVPLQVGDDILGVIEVADIEVEHFGATDLKLIESLASSAAVAIEKARLYQLARREIVERKRAEAALRESEERYRSLFEGVPVGLYRTTAMGQILNANPALVQMLGYPGQEAMLTVNVADTCADPKARKRWQTSMERDGIVRNFEMQVRRHDGVIIWVQDNARLVQDADGRALYYEGSLEDITERKALQEMWKRYDFIANTSKDFMTLIDESYTYEAVNESYCSAHNKKREEILGRTVADVWSEERFSTQIAEYLDRCFAGSEVHYQAWFELATLGLRYWDVAYYPYYNNEGIVTHAVVVSRDITDQKQAEQALQKAHAQNKQLLASISSILIGVGPDTRITHWNTPAEAAFGIAAADVIGQPFFDCGIQWDWSETGQRIAKGRQENQPTHLSDVRYTRPDGKEGFLNLTLNPFVGEVPGRSGFHLLGEEITERKVLEMQLAQAQKLEAIGQLAAGIAHEINTPIQYVGDNVRFLKESFTDLSRLLDEYHRLLQAAKAGSVPSKRVAGVENAVSEADLAYLSQEIPSAIQDSLEGIARVTEIVRAMREFSHPGVEEKTAIDVNKAIESTITVARNEWKYVAEIETDLDTEMPLVPCLPGEFNQVILNVLVNAAHAIADVVGDGAQGKGIISVSTRCVGDWAEIRISDTGTGIPEKVRPRIFDLFFTTKKMGQGTGQGLTIAHNVIVEKHGGSITFETQVGKGTTFIIRLPTADGLE